MEYFEKIKKKIVSADATIIQTMKMMDNCFTKLLLVFDDEKFLGIITNGDLQRAIIKNIPFETHIGKIVSHEGKVYAHVGDNRDRIKEQMLAMRAELMPVLDDNGQLVDVIFWEDVLSDTKTNDSRPKIDLPVVIMAGGLGTRLKPLTNIIPKPLIPINEKTILETIIDQFEKIGCTKYYLSVNYKREIIEYYFDKLDKKYDITFLKEDKPLGTIGSVSLLKGKIDKPFSYRTATSLLTKTIVMCMIIIKITKTTSLL